MTNSDFTNIQSSAGDKKALGVSIKQAGDVGAAPVNDPSQVIERTIHTILKIKIYPDGSMYVNKAQSWVDKKGFVVKKKVVKKPVKLKDVELGEEEIY